MYRSSTALFHRAILSTQHPRQLPQKVAQTLYDIARVQKPFSQKTYDPYYFRPALSQEDQVSIVNPYDNKLVSQRYGRSKIDLSRSVIDRIQSFLKLDEKLEKALDIGCATGVSTLPLKQLAHQVVGIDASEHMIKHAQQEEHVEYFHASAESLPFDNNTFDLITIGKAFHWMNQGKVLNETSRLLRDGGSLIIYDHRFVPYHLDDIMPIEKKLYEWFELVFLKEIPQVSGGEKYSPSKLKMKEYFYVHEEKYADAQQITLDQFIGAAFVTSGAANYMMTHTKEEVEQKHNEMKSSLLSYVFDGKQLEPLNILHSGNIWYLTRIPRHQYKLYSLYGSEQKQATTIFPRLIYRPTSIDNQLLECFPGGINLYQAIKDHAKGGFIFSNGHQLLFYIIENRLFDNLLYKDWIQNLQRLNKSGELNQYIGMLGLPANINHILLSPDGNRRWASLNKADDISLGHMKLFTRNLPKIIKNIFILDVHSFTIWNTSMNNLVTRDPGQLLKLFFYISQSLDIYFNLAMQLNIRINRLGSDELLETSDPLVRKHFHNLLIKFEVIEKKTQHFTKHYLNIAINYDGHDDLLRGVNRINKSHHTFFPVKHQDLLNNTDMSKQIYPHPDIHIRAACSPSGGRSGGPFLLETANTHIYFTPKLAPDLVLDDMFEGSASCLHPLSTYRSRDNPSRPKL